MLGCCHCLCSKEYSALTCVASCYPNDGRADPVHARVRELINWGTHDIDRFSTIHEILADRIKSDVRTGNDAGVQVGLKIMASLLNSVRELNHNISTTMTACIIQLIETKRQPLLEIAARSTFDLIEFTNNHMLQTPICRIINAYLLLLTEESLKETIFQSVTSIVSKSHIQWIPITNILKTICTDYFAENSARDIIKAIAHVVLPLSLNKLTADLFNFFSENNLWNDEDFVSSIIILFFNEVPDSCAPGFFRSWLEQLPPRSPEVGHCKTIINITVRLVEQIAPERLVSQAQTEALNTLYLFVLNLPQLMYDDKASILDNSLVIESFIVSHIPLPELLKIAHRQIWEWLPEEQDKQVDYEHEKVGLIFRLATTFNNAAKSNLTKGMINDSLVKIKKFLVAFRHDEIILGTVLDHIKDIGNVYPAAKSDSIINFLIDLQKEVKHRGNDITLHTFIMSAITEAVKDGPQPLTSYVQEICNKRIESTPPQVDLSLSFIVNQFPQLKGAKPGAKAAVTDFFKKRVIKELTSLRRNSTASVYQSTAEKLQRDNSDEEEEVSEIENAAIPALVFPDQGEVSEDSVVDPIPSTFDDALKVVSTANDNMKKYREDIDNISFEWKSPVPLPTQQ